MTTQAERALERVLGFGERLMTAAMDIVDRCLVGLLHLASSEMVWFAGLAGAVVLLFRAQ